MKLRELIQILDFNILGFNLKNAVKRFSKFAGVGVIVTLTTMGLNYIFLEIIGTSLVPTYVLIYLAMIYLSFLLNSFFTFKAKRSLKKLFLYYGSYGISLLLGVFLLSFFKKTFPFENWILAYMVIPFTMTSNFLLSSLIFRKKK